MSTFEFLYINEYINCVIFTIHANQETIMSTCNSFSDEKSRSTINRQRFKCETEWTKMQFMTMQT